MKNDGRKGGRGGAPRKGRRDYDPSAQRGERTERPYGNRPPRTGSARPSHPGQRTQGTRSAYPGQREEDIRPAYPTQRAQGPRPSRPPQRTQGQFRDERMERAPYPAEEAPAQPERQTVPAENLLVGRNPIREALKAGRSFESLYVQKGELNGSAREIVRMAKERRVMVKEVDRRALEAMSPGHQGLVAVVSAHEYSTVEDILAKAEQKGEPPLIVVLDGITDPHNMGAIARTAECCGAHGLILCERRAVGMTPGAAKAAAGAFEYLPVARVPNIARLIDQLKEKNIWVYAADQEADASHTKTDLTGPLALVIGDEGEGVSRLALSKCDGRISIPIRGSIGSLNASVAAGVLLYEALRQRIG